jgi:hypothetical protein
MSILPPKRRLVVKDQHKEWNQIVLEIQDEKGRVISDIGLDPITARRVARHIAALCGARLVDDTAPRIIRPSGV